MNAVLYMVKRSEAKEVLESNHFAFHAIITQETGMPKTSASLLNKVWKY